MTKYMHTINCKPARYWPGQQICYVDHGFVKLEPDLRTIRKHQMESAAWRKRRFKLYENDLKYGYVKVSV